MAKEHAKNCKLLVGDGYALTITGSIYAVTVAGPVYKITRNAGDFAAAGVKVGQAVKASGFATAINNFVAHVFAVSALDITLKLPVDPVTGNPVVPVAEALGAAVTLKFSTFTEIGGQQNTRFSGSSQNIDVSDKNSGGWGASIQGTKAASLEASGIVNWPDTAGLKYVRDQWAAGNTVEAKAVMNATGDFWFTDWSLQNFEEGGSHEEATNYSLSMANALRANMVYWS